MSRAVKSNLLLYADDSCLMYQHKDIAIIEKIVNEDFENICGWFVDNKLRIHKFTYSNRNETTRTGNISWMCIRRVNAW